jgi:NADH-quinone oxidoreductase subunit L
MVEASWLANHAYLIPLLPLGSALIIFFFGDWLPVKGAWLGILAIAASWLFSIELFLNFSEGSLPAGFERTWAWFSAGIYPFEWGILLDGPSIVMLLVVTTVSMLVQVYSLGYMHDAPRFKRFYAYLSLFTFSMLGLVLANNYLQFFVGWELMGACSYFLISFEFERDAAGAAGNKAFLTTRLGDIGFYIGLLTIFYSVGTFNFMQIQAHLHDGTLSSHMAYIIALLVFCGSVGKSAQFPLHVWLPDAMEGPTPVSALIHAATMVAAGVYLVARTYPFFVVAPSALEVVAWVGGITAFFAATIAVTANDIKKVLAYSTISQLGYMIMAMGVSGYTAGLFHLTTHAAFKALLFLGAGSVIHSVHTNDMWKMGSLSKQMLITTITFFCGYLALVSFPFTSGYYSKEMVLGAAYGTHHYALFAIGCVGAFLTAFYMTRAYALTFLGEARERDRFAHAHESPLTMTLPLMFLAVPAILLGITMHSSGMVEKLLGWTGGGLPEIEESSLATYIGVGSGLFGIFMGVILYLGRHDTVAKIAKAFNPIYQLLVHKYYVDEFYWAVFVRPVGKLAKALDWFDLHVIDRIFVDGWLASGLSVINSWLDDHVVDGAVNGMGESVTDLGALARRVQNGFVQNYLLVVTIGFVCMVLWMDNFLGH